MLVTNIVIQLPKGFEFLFSSENNNNKDDKIYYKGTDVYQLAFLYAYHNRIPSIEEVEMIEKKFTEESKMLLSKDAASKSKLKKLKSIIYSSFNIEAICRFNKLFQMNFLEFRNRCIFLVEIRRINRLYKKTHTWLEDALIKAVQEGQDAVYLYNTKRYTIKMYKRSGYYTVCLNSVDYFNFIIENNKVKILSLEETRELKKSKK